MHDSNRKTSVLAAFKDIFILFVSSAKGIGLIVVITECIAFVEGICSGGMKFSLCLDQVCRIFA